VESRRLEWICEIPWMVRIAITIPTMNSDAEKPIRVKAYTMKVAVMHPVVPAYPGS
jgi:hypothetical protein